MILSWKSVHISEIFKCIAFSFISILLRPNFYGIGVVGKSYRHHLCFFTLCCVCMAPFAMLIKLNVL